MAKNLIRWNRSDYARLRSAISSFNKQVNKLEQLESKTEYLPDIKNYSEVKERIVSRRELNRVIKSLKDFSNEKMQERFTTPSGEVITRWENKQVNLARRRAIRTLESERLNIEVGRKSIGMGDERLKEINRTIESFNKLETKTGRDFTRTKESILLQGTSDRELYKAKVFQENFYKALDSMKKFDNYDVLKKELDKYKNPISFYNRVKDSDILMDIFHWYKGQNGEILVYGGFETSQDAFNTAIQVDLGLDIKE